MKKQVAAEAEEVKAAGGLYVLGTERHESRRIDNQLRGRSAARATRASRGSTCRWATTSCAGSTARPSSRS
jgi:hypothetical protein